MACFEVGLGNATPCCRIHHHGPTLGQHLSTLLAVRHHANLGPLLATPSSFHINSLGNHQSTSPLCSALSHPRPPQPQSQLSESLQEWAPGTPVGMRYQAMLPTDTLLGMPTPARAAIESSQAHFLWLDRGHVGGSNNSSADSKLCHFANWLGSKGYHKKQSACSITQNLAIDLIGAYLSWLRRGKYLPSNSKGPIGEQAL
jgi:hypothetical protein